MQASLERLRARREELEGAEGGFTLIELLIVIVILAILAAIVVFAVQNLTGTSAQSSCRADFKTVESGVEAFKAQTGAYPGGTYLTGYTVAPLADTNGYTSPTASAAPHVDNHNGVQFLMQTTDTDAATPANSIGPWLKDWPVNNGHYEIVVSYPGTGGATTLGQIDVYNSTGTALVAATPAHSAADCAAVK